MKHDNSRRRRFLTAIISAPLTSTLLLLTSVTSAHADTIVTKLSFKGYMIYGDGYTRDGCLGTQTGLSADESTVSYSASQYNFCTDTTVSFLVGQATPSVFKVKGSLGSAHVVATIPVIDAETGNAAGEVVVDETFIGEGQVERESYVERVRYAGYMQTNRVSGNIRQARASGTVYLDYANIRKVSQAFLSISRS